MPPDFYALTKIEAGAYLGMTPRGTQYLLLSYYEDGSAQSGGRTLKGTFWCVVEITEEFDFSLSLPSGRLDWFEALDEGWFPPGLRLRHTSFRTRYAARNWADLEMDDAALR